VIVVALLLSSILSTFMGFILAPWFMQIVKLPSRFLAPGIFVLALIGALAARQRPQDALLVTVAGIVGFALKKNGFNLIPVVIGLVLGRTIEITLNQTLLVQGVAGFVNRPISLGILVIGGGGIMWAIRRNIRINRQTKEARYLSSQQSAGSDTEDK
jgi:putative tricarboxylic transport membrane protein